MLQYNRNSFRVQSEAIFVSYCSLGQSLLLSSSLSLVRSLAWNRLLQGDNI